MCETDATFSMAMHKMRLPRARDELLYFTLNVTGAMRGFQHKNSTNLFLRANSAHSGDNRLEHRKLVTGNLQGCSHSPKGEMGS